jgi:hypothetical protein
MFYKDVIDLAVLVQLDPLCRAKINSLQQDILNLVFQTTSGISQNTAEVLVYSIQNMQCLKML